MPVNEFEGNTSWGYNPSFYFAVDKYYGTKNDLRAFVDECHGQGMAVIIDLVLNHSFGQSPFYLLYKMRMEGPLLIIRGIIKNQILRIQVFHGDMISIMIVNIPELWWIV